MNEMKKRNFQVLENSEEELEERKHARNMAILKIVVFVAVIVVCVAAAVLVWLRYRTYDSYEVKEEIKTETLSEAEFYDYGDAVLKVSKNGAIYSTVGGELIWNQSYEMNAPIVDICEDYVVIGAQKGTEIYILNKQGLKGKIETTRQIRAVEVAGQGTVAVMTEKNKSYYINLYDTDGEELVQGEMHIENSGYPLSMSLSPDAIKLAVALVDVSKGQANSTVNFYNFGTVGQNEIDNLVSSYTYEGLVIPRIQYLNDNKVVAFSNGKLLFFGGAQKPEESAVVPVTEEIRSVFYSDKYVGITYNVEPDKTASGDAAKEQEKSSLMHEVAVYDLKGKEVMKKQYKEDYGNVEILGNSELVFTLGEKCMICSMDGVIKFEGELEQEVLKMEQTGVGNEYYVIFKDRVQKIRLK
ncbi:MAG: DUF5711 family protein [Lachnospiraceae bacterium]